MKAIKHVLTERFYVWEDARKLAENDPEIDLSGEGAAYTPMLGYEDDVTTNKYLVEEAETAAVETPAEQEAEQKEAALATPKAEAELEVKPAAEAEPAKPAQSKPAEEVSLPTPKF